MKRKFLSILVFFSLMSCMFTALPVSAAKSGTCGGDLVWELDDSGTLTITGTGDMTNYVSVNDVPWYTFKKDIVQVKLSNGVNNIGRYAFWSCGSLIRVDIGTGMKTIGIRAFDNCSNLVNVVSNSNIEIIEDYAFNSCSNLTNIEFRTGLKKIGERAFYNCNSLKSLNIPDTAVSIGNQAFYNTGVVEVSFGSGVQTIGTSAFGWCTKLTKVKMGNGVKSIGQGAFSNCRGLMNLDMSGNIEAIGVGAFTGCKIIANVYYGGSESAWKNVVIGSGNEYLTNAKVHYNCNLGGTVLPEPQPQPVPQPEPIPVPQPEQQTSNAIKVYVNNTPVNFDQEPIIINDRVMVPIRAVAEAMGDSVQWEGKWNAALIIHPDRVVGFKTGNNTARIAKGTGLADYSEYYCDVPPQNINGRVLTPLRAIGETLGAQVEWDGNAKCVYITTGQRPAKTMTDNLVQQILNIFEKWFI